MPAPRGKDIFYIPGGKREDAESDLRALLHEITEELAVALLPETVRHIGTYQADQPGGAVARMSCYTAGYCGTLAPISEIVEFAWLTYADRPEVPLVDRCSSTTSTRPGSCDDPGCSQAPTTYATAARE